MNEVRGTNIVFDSQIGEIIAKCGYIVETLQGTILFQDGVSGQLLDVQSLERCGDI